MFFHDADWMFEAYPAYIMFRLIDVSVQQSA